MVLLVNFQLTMEDQAIEGRRQPRSTHVRVHVGGVRAVVRPAEARGAVVPAPVLRDA